MKSILLALLFLSIQTFAQDKPSYRIFTVEGKQTNYDQMVKAISRSEIIFFGELHNNSLAHWLELQILKDLYNHNSQLVLAMEMFEADDQIVLDEYLNGTIEEKHVLKEAKVWDNYKTDYRPLVEFSKNKKLRVVASNIPRRYASLVFKKGLQALDSLSLESKKWIAPLPVNVDMELKCYKDLLMGMDQHGGSGENLAKSQAIKDATMAYFIEKNKKANDIMVHVNGAYHSQDGEGIIWYLKKSNPKVKIATVQVVEQNNLERLEDANRSKADFVICVPVDMTKTY